MKNEKITNYTIKVNLPGGIISVGDLFDILHAVEKSGVENIHFGNRQQLFFDISKDGLEDLEHNFFVNDTTFEIESDDYPNIISSYVTEDIFENTNWLREGVYKDIIDSFNYLPKLKINLVDNTQTLIPFFTGNLNFIASEISNYWYLYIRFPKTNIIHSWSALVYSEDINSLSRLIEKSIFDDINTFYDQEFIDGHKIELKVRSASNFFFQPLTTALKLPDFQLPYYEGFNKYNDKFWLGIYRRSELFSVSFLKDICTVCKKLRIGQIYTTPWKSIIIKGIEPADRKLWNKILGKHRINVRHASNELNWQIEDLCEYSLNLKYELVKEFDKFDLRTFKLCFAIKINPKSGLFGSVIIKKLPSMASQAQDDGDFFDIMHTTDFNPNSKVLVLYQNNVKRENLSLELATLCDHFYEQQGLHPNDIDVFQEEDNSNTEDHLKIFYQCKHCLSIYDEDSGDERQGISPGTLFSEIGIKFRCSICDASKEDFNQVEKLMINL